MNENPHRRTRIVLPELLDHLPADDPHAIRSRRDLHRINRLMGNTAWILTTLQRFPNELQKGVVEWGAGDGILLNELVEKFPHCRISACDLAPRPAQLHPDVEWRQADLLQTPTPGKAGVLIANLFLHHFKKPDLARLGAWCGNFDVLIFNEPDRATLPHLLGNIIHPFINHVTRHDMHVSIDAGFAKGELAEDMGLLEQDWEIHESSTLRGSRRWIARKRDFAI